jgi:hypothetical protein
MIKNCVLIIIIGVVISGCASTDFGRNFGRGSGEDIGADLFIEDKSVSGPRRGIVVNFIDGKPYDFDEKEMSGASFNIGLKIGNYMDEKITGTLEIHDTSALTGFDKVTAPLTLEPAIYENDKFVEHSYYKFVTKNRYSYRQDKIHEASTSWFSAEVKYDKISTFKFRPCFVDLSGKRDGSCAVSGESFSNEKLLGKDYSRDPVIVKSIKKDLKDGDEENSVKMKLKVVISNEGKGEIINIYDPAEKGKMVFNLIGNKNGTSVEFDCEGDDVVGGDSGLGLELDMEDKKSVELDCTAEIFNVVDPINKMEGIITLGYGYVYKEETPVLKVNKG